MTRRQNRDAGTTLVELVVAMGLLAVLGSLVCSLVVNTQRQSAAGRIRLADVDQTRVGMNALTRALRTAVQPAQLQSGCSSCLGPASSSTALTSAEADRLQLFANFGDAAGPFLVTFAVATNAAGMAELKQTVQRPDTGSAPNFTYTACTEGAAGCKIATRTLVHGLTWPLPGAVFGYRDNTAAPLVPSLAANGHTQLTPVQLLAVDAIDVTLPVHTPNSYHTAPTTAVTRVSLPNAASGVIATPVPMAGTP
jgi:type II secretory pathway pseudopilin PulG